MKEIQGPAKAGLEFINRRKKTQTKKKSEPKRTPPKKNSTTELAFQFRQYAKTHDLYKIESDTNCLKLEDAFGDPIKAVFQELSSKKQRLRL